MKVTAYKTVEVECECDVGIDEVLSEFAQRADEASVAYFRRVAPALDWMTRILASVKDETIHAIPHKARQTLCDRLEAEAKRYRVGE